MALFVFLVALCESRELLNFRFGAEMLILLEQCFMKYKSMAESSTSLSLIHI